MAIQFRTSMDAPHPAAQQDINYAIRWLKAHAGDFNASPDRVGGAGWSSGGHQIMLAGMKPHDYEEIALPEAPDIHGSLAYVIMGWPVIDPLARYRLAQEKGNVELQARHNRYFGDEAGMIAASPPHMIERGERVDTPPALLLQGSADEGLPQGMAERFVQLYSERGGIIELASTRASRTASCATTTKTRAPPSAWPSRSSPGTSTRRKRLAVAEAGAAVVAANEMREADRRSVCDQAIGPGPAPGHELAAATPTRRPAQRTRWSSACTRPAGCLAKVPSRTASPSQRRWMCRSRRRRG